MRAFFGSLRRRKGKKSAEQPSRPSSFESSAVVESATPETPSISLPPSEPQSPSTQSSVRGRPTLLDSGAGEPATPVPQQESLSSLQMLTPSPAHGDQHRQSLQLPSPDRPHSRASSHFSAQSAPSSYSINPDYHPVDYEDDAVSDLAPDAFYGAYVSKASELT